MKKIFILSFIVVVIFSFSCNKEEEQATTSTSDTEILADVVSDLAIPGAVTFEHPEIIGDSSFFKQSAGFNYLAASTTYAIITLVTVASIAVDSAILSIILDELYFGEPTNLEIIYEMDSDLNITYAQVSFDALVDIGQATTRNFEVIYTAQEAAGGGADFDVNVTCLDCILLPALQAGMSLVAGHAPLTIFNVEGDIVGSGTGWWDFYSPVNGSKYITVTWDVDDADNYSLTFEGVDSATDYYGDSAVYSLTSGNCARVEYNDASEDTQSYVVKDMTTLEGKVKSAEDVELCWDENLSNIECADLTTTCVE